MTGILLVDKPCGVSSAGAIRALKGRLGGAKVGHLGTLDPFASGLLPLCIGEATKLARYLLLEEKAYSGLIRLGATTDTLDGTGAVIERLPVPDLTAERIAAVAARFTGPQLQTPPMYSALKRDGVPLYKLARRGVEVERQAREIDVRSLALVPAGPDALEFEVVCSKGTYVRVLAADVGRALGTVAHLERLRRTAVGPFRVEEARTPEALVGLADADWPLVPIARTLAGLVRFPLPAGALESLRHGRQEPLRELPAGRSGQTALVMAGPDAIAAVIEMAGTPPAWRLVRLVGGW
jgi:tRNA pseudouridine55 synthase